MKQTIKLRESELKRVIAESVKRAINEVWDIDDNGVIDYDEFGRAKNRSYADVKGLSRGLASDTKELLRNTPHKDFRAETNYQYRLDEPNGREFSDDSGEWLRPSDWFARGADGWNDDEFNDYDKQIGNKHGTNTSASDKRWKKAADSRPLHRKGSLNRAMDETINRIVSESVKRVLRESQFMNDEDIASQYKDMRITYFDIKPLTNSDGWEGTFELEFPNADNIDFDGTMVNDFIVYDMVGNQIAWDNWMPDEQTRRLEKIIRQEIVKRTR